VSEEDSGQQFYEDRERQLASALADLLDGRPRAESVPIPAELAPEIDALGEIDRILSPSALLPERLSGHKIAGEIGSGGMGCVFLAVDEALGRTVAIKTLADRYAGDAVVRARFMAEARATARFNHPNIVRIYHLLSLA
jgi:Protein kinase domain